MRNLSTGARYTDQLALLDERDTCAPFPLKVRNVPLHFTSIESSLSERISPLCSQYITPYWRHPQGNPCNYYRTPTLQTLEPAVRGILLGVLQNLQVHTHISSPKPVFGPREIQLVYCLVRSMNECTLGTTERPIISVHVSYPHSLRRDVALQHRWFCVVPSCDRKTFFVARHDWGCLTYHSFCFTHCFPKKWRVHYKG